jgi:hypothetical protein
MTRTADIARLIALVLVVVATVGVATPVCAMPGCADTGTGVCSDFVPACDGCPKTVVMKHTHDEAVTNIVAVEPPVAVAELPEAPVPQLPSVALVMPEPTASPPPLEPLGVRLTI